MIIDAHSHILSLAEDPEFTRRVRARGFALHLPQHGAASRRTACPPRQEWEASGYTRKGWPVIGPEESLRDHPGFDKVVVLAISPQLLDGTADRHGRHRPGVLGARRPACTRTGATTTSRRWCAPTPTGSSASRR